MVYLMVKGLIKMYHQVDIRIVRIEIEDVNVDFH